MPATAAVTPEAAATPCHTDTGQRRKSQTIHQLTVARPVHRTTSLTEAPGRPRITCPGPLYSETPQEADEGAVGAGMVRCFVEDALGDQAQTVGDAPEEMARDVGEVLLGDGVALPPGRAWPCFAGAYPTQGSQRRSSGW